jgi:hypothetical protein
MGASVGIGGLIVGVAMLVVFSMAYQSIAMQIDSGLDRIENAETPIPAFSVDDATLWEGAVVALDIANGGSGYSAGGTLAAQSGNGGFSGTYTINLSTGAITSVVITSHGNYSSPPTIVVSGGGSGTSAQFTPWLGNVVYMNATNTGSTTIGHDEMWLFTNGSGPTAFDTVYTSSIGSSNWYSGETVSLQWINATNIGTSRLALTVGAVSIGATLA